MKKKKPDLESCSDSEFVNGKYFPGSDLIYSNDIRINSVLQFYSIIVAHETYVLYLNKYKKM